MGMPTMQPIANITLAGTTTSVIFSNITQAYRDLVIVSNGLSNSSGNEIFVNLNGDTTSNYGFVQIYSTGTSNTSNSGVNTFASAGRQSTAAASNVLTIFDYSTTDKHKSMLLRGDLASQYTTLQALRWSSNSAVTTVGLYPGTGSFSAGSSFAVYGVIA